MKRRYYARVSVYVAKQSEGQQPQWENICVLASDPAEARDRVVSAFHAMGYDRVVITGGPTRLDAG